MLPSPATEGGKSESLGLGPQANPLRGSVRSGIRAREHSKPAQPTGAAHRTGILKPLRAGTLYLSVCQTERNHGTGVVSNGLSKPELTHQTASIPYRT
jgi:hypothetical protein